MSGLPQNSQDGALMCAVQAVLRQARRFQKKLSVSLPNHPMTSTLKKIDSATLEATVELGKEDLANSVAQAERNLAAMLTMDGFRQGKVPPEVARKHINEQQLREEALQIAVRQSLVDVAKKEKLDVMDQKDFVIKENTPEKLLYQVTLLLFPAVTLGNYKG